MKYLPLIFRNLLRRKIRTTLTILSIAVSLFLYGLLATIDAAFNQGVAVAGADRLVSRNRTSIIMPLPFAYRDRIAQIEGVESVTFACWFGGVYKDERNFFPQFAIDADTFPEMYPEFAIEKQQLEDFRRDRQACIVGRLTATKFGIKVGDRMPIRGTIFPGAWEFNVRGIYDGTRPEDDATQFWFHYDYLDEQQTFIRGRVGWYIIRVRNPDDAEKIAKLIDARFANSSSETVTEPEKVFMQGWVKMMGNIQLLIISIGVVVLFTLLLVTGNTMAIAVRERTGELAVLKTVGFSDRVVLALVLAESFTIALIGGALGLGLAKVVTLGGDPTGGFLPVFYFSPTRVAGGVVLAGLVGLASGLIPAILAMRLRIVDALRRV